MSANAAVSAVSWFPGLQQPAPARSSCQPAPSADIGRQIPRNSWHVLERAIMPQRALDLYLAPNLNEMKTSNSRPGRFASLCIWLHIGDLRSRNEQAVWVARFRSARTVARGS